MARQADRRNDIQSIMSRSRHSSRFWWAWGSALGVASILVVLASLPPFLEVGPRVLLHHGFSWACHQIPERSFHVNGISLAVCHRCYGIYWGLPLAVIGFLGLYRWDDLLHPHAKYILLGSLFPPGIDWMGGLMGLWTSTPATRVITGLAFGLTAGYFLARAFVTAMERPSEEETPLHDVRSSYVYPAEDS